MTRLNTSAEMAPEQFMSLIPVIILYFALMAVAIAYAVVFLHSFVARLFLL